MTDRTEAEKLINKTWATKTKEGKLYGYYFYPRYPKELRDKIKSFHKDGLLTDNELKRLDIEQTSVGGGFINLYKQTEKEGIEEMKNQCIQFEMKRER